MEVNIVRLIENQPLDKLSHKTNNILVSKLQETFSDEEQQLFLASFWCYQNHKADEFIIDLDNIWKWLGFARKDPAKRVINKTLMRGRDYNIVLRQPVENPNGGRPNEQIMMTIDGFKKLALKSNTKKADTIHEYYMKLEKVIQELFHEETQRITNELEEQKELNKKLIKRVKRKIKEKEKLGKCVYIMKDKDEPTHFKFGKTSDINHRLTNLNCASAEEHIVLHKHWYTRFNYKIEQLVLHAFRNYREANNTELIEIEQLEVLEDFVDNLINLLKPFEDDLDELDNEETEENSNNRQCDTCHKNLSFDHFHKSGKINEKQYYKLTCKDCDSKEYAQKVKTINKIKCKQCNEYLALKYFFKNDENEYMSTCSICFKPNHRQCKTCTQIYPLNNFSGLLPNCKECHNKKRRESKTIVECEYCSKKINEENLSRHQESILCREVRGFEVSKSKLRSDSRTIIQLDLKTNEIIEKFESLSVAYNKTKVAMWNISRVCRGERKSAGGFRWQWKD